MHDDTTTATQAQPQTDTGGPFTPSAPDFVETLSDLQGGRFSQILTGMLANCAMAVAAQDGPVKSQQKAKLVLTLELEPTSAGDMLEVVHRAEFKHPTVKGWQAEQVGDRHPMFVNRRGALSVVRDEQGKLDFGNGA